MLSVHVSYVYVVAVIKLSFIYLTQVCLKVLLHLDILDVLDCVVMRDVEDSAL